MSELGRRSRDRGGGEGAAGEGYGSRQTPARTGDPGALTRGACHRQTRDSARARLVPPCVCERLVERREDRKRPIQP